MISRTQSERKLPRPLPPSTSALDCARAVAARARHFLRGRAWARADETDTAPARADRNELNQQLNHINWDLDDISDSISIVEKNRSKYKIDDAEVRATSQRNRWANEALGRVRIFHRSWARPSDPPAEALCSRN